MAHEDHKTEGPPFSSLPPDSAGVDLNWDDDVASARLRSAPPTAPPAPRELDIGDRITAVPDLPIAELNAYLLKELEQGTEESPSPAPEAPTMPGPTATRRRHWSSQSTLPPAEALRANESTAEQGPDVSAPSSRGRASAAMLGSKKPPEPARRKSSSSRALVLPHDELTLDLDDLPRGDHPVAHRVGRTVPADPTPPGAAHPLPGPGTESEPRLPSATTEVLRGQLRDRYAVGDFSGALESAEQLLALDADDVDALRYAESCRDVLFQMLTARVGSLDRVIKTAVAPDQIRWLSLNHRAGFLLSLVDGMSTAEELLDISGMSRLEALRILSDLLEQRIVAFAAPDTQE
jgi:hypothetical protein